MKRVVIVSAVGLAVAALTLSRFETAAGAQQVTGRAVAAANKYLQLLDETQRAETLFEFASAKKAAWHNGPPTSNPRNGTKFAALSPPQLAAAHDLMRSVTSQEGYQKVVNIMDSDEVFGRAGSSFPTGPGAYSIAIFGTPSTTTPWAVQVNGHHLGLNVTMVGSENILAPSLTGAYPATFEKDGRTIRTLAAETDTAMTLIEMLRPDQRAKAILPHLTGDLVLGPGQDGKVIQPEGLKASEMTAPQKAALVDLTAAWVRILDKPAADAKLKEIRQHIDETYLAWAGDTTRGGRAYFRVQGPTVFIEYGPMVNVGGPNPGRGRGAGRGGAPNAETAPPLPPGQLATNRDPNHVHTIFRDFANDYGKRTIK